MQIKEEEILKKFEFKSKSFTDFIAFNEKNESSKETISSNILKLNNLFPDENKLKRKRKQLKKSKQKLVAVFNKNKKNEEKIDNNEKLCINKKMKLEESSKEIKSENLFVKTNNSHEINFFDKTYHNSCSRLIILN